MSEQYTNLAFESNESVQIKGSIIATWALAVIAVCLRFIARRFSKAGFWYDDWFMGPAIVSIPLLNPSSNYAESLGEQIKLIRVPARCCGAVLHLCFLE